MNRTTNQKLLGVFASITLSGSVAFAQTEVRIASHVSEFAPLVAQAQKFAQEVEKELPNRFEFKIYPSGQLGKEKALISNVKSGSLEMISVASGILKLDKKLGIFDLPWLFSDRGHVRRAMKAGLENDIRQLLESQGMVVIGIYENGFRHILNGKRSIVQPRHLRGLKIRISGGKFRQDVFRSLGAVPQKVAWKETFTALQTGVVDGAEAATYGFYEQKQYEVAKYLSLTSHVYTPGFLIMSKKLFNSLSQKEQNLVKNIGQRITDFNYNEARKLESKYFNIIKKHTKINQVDLPLFKSKVKKVYASYKKSYGEKWLNLIEETR